MEPSIKIPEFINWRIQYIMTDLACIIRSIRTTMVEKRDYSEAETKELVKQAVRLGFATDEEITQEAMTAMGKVMMLLKNLPL